MKILFVLLLLLSLNYVNAQSHISTGKYGCRLVPKSLNTEKELCPACEVNDKRIAEAKRVEEKRKSQEIYARSVATEKATNLASQKKQKEREQKNNVTELGLEMPSDNSSNNSVAKVENDDIDSSDPKSETEAIVEDADNSPVKYISSGYTNSTKTEIYVQAATAVGNLMDNWNASYERKMAQREAESSAAANIERQKRDDKFKSVYLPLMDLANNGDEDARMILYFTSEIFMQKYSVPSRDQWYRQALANKNKDALALKVHNVLYQTKSFEPYMEEIAKENVDVMMMLASWYDLSNDSNAEGGNDPKKALEYYMMAAEKGSPNAMYKLGMIYKYGRTPDITEGHGFLKKWHVKYDIVPDETIAFEWFKKSLFPRYKESIFAKSISGDRDFGLSIAPSYFERKTYLELADIYTKGKVIAKDKDLAIELERMYNGYVNKQTFDYISKK